eukprot:COSAG01_NODE_938_length_12628_cov_8.320137_16_plen_89_part_00
MVAVVHDGTQAGSEIAALLSDKLGAAVQRVAELPPAVDAAAALLSPRSVLLVSSEAVSAVASSASSGHTGRMPAALLYRRPDDRIGQR